MKSNDKVIEDIANGIESKINMDNETIQYLINSFFAKLEETQDKYIINDIKQPPKIFDAGDWKNDLTQSSNEWRFENSQTVILLRNLKPDFTDIISILSGFVPDWKSTVVSELFFSFFKVRTKLQDDEYCIFIHAEEVDRLSSDRYHNYEDYIPKCRDEECDNKSDLWICPFCIEGCCKISEDDVLKTLDKLFKKNILTRRYDNKFKFNRW